MRPTRLSPRVGGRTFPEDPAHSCAQVLPVWTAGVDAHVLAVRASPDARDDRWRLDLRRHDVRILKGPGSEHIRIDHAGHVVRLDVIDGTPGAGIMALRVELDIGPDLPAQADAARTLLHLVSGTLPAKRHHDREASALLGLWALDARREGASLRDIADMLLGPGDWPGDGEHRKSRARRLVASGEAMVKAGPGAILR